MSKEEKKLEDFNKEMRALLGKYEYVLSAVPFIDGTGRILAKPAVLPLKKESALEE